MLSRPRHPLLGFRKGKTVTESCPLPLKLSRHLTTLCAGRREERDRRRTSERGGRGGQGPEARGQRSAPAYCRLLPGEGAGAALMPRPTVLGADADTGMAAHTASWDNADTHQRARAETRPDARRRERPTRTQAQSRAASARWPGHVWLAVTATVRKLRSPGGGDSVAAGKDAAALPCAAAALPCAAAADVGELPGPRRGVGELGARVVPAHQALAVLVALPLLLLQGVVARRHGLQQPLLGGKQEGGGQGWTIPSFRRTDATLPLWTRNPDCRTDTHAFKGPRGRRLCTHHPAAVADVCTRAAESHFPGDLPQLLPPHPNSGSMNLHKLGTAMQTVTRPDYPAFNPTALRIAMG